MDTLIDYVPLNIQFPRTLSGFRYQQYRRDRNFFRWFYPSGISIFKTVEQDITVTQSIGKHVSVSVLVSQSITLTDFAENLLPKVTQEVTVTQDIVVYRVINRSVSQNITLTQEAFVQSPRVISVFQTATVTQTIVDRLGVNRQSIGHLIILTDSVTGRLGTYRHTISQSITTSESIIRRERTINDSVSQNAVVTQRVGTQYKQSVAHFVSVVHTVQGHRELNYIIDTPLDVDSDFTYARYLIQNLITNDTLVSNLTRIVTLTIPIVTLVESDNDFVATVLYTPPILTTLPPLGTAPTLPPLRPQSSGTNYINSQLTVITTKKGAIILPVPELGDTLGNVDTVAYKYNMAGSIRTYVTSSVNRAFSLTFNLSRLKALELREWLTINLVELMTITLWKGEIWECRLINDDLQFLAENRWSKEREKIVITLDFEGHRTHG